MKNIIFALLLFCSNAFAETIILSNKLRFFEKENFSAIVAKPLCELFDVNIQTVMPENQITVQKLHEQNISCNEFNLKLQIYFHHKGTEKYLSQQLLITGQGEDIALCTSYFSLSEKFLVPGACVGTFNKKSIGISVFK